MTRSTVAGMATRSQRQPLFVVTKVLLVLVVLQCTTTTTKRLGCHSFSMPPPSTLTRESNRRHRRCYDVIFVHSPRTRTRCNLNNSGSNSNNNNNVDKGFNLLEVASGIVPQGRIVQTAKESWKFVWKVRPSVKKMPMKGQAALAPLL